MQMVTLETGDSYDKVAQFYKDQYKDKKANVMDMSHGGAKMTHIILSDDQETTTLMITEKDGKTQIIISKNTKSSSK